MERTLSKKASKPLNFAKNSQTRRYPLFHPTSKNASASFSRWKLLHIPAYPPQEHMMNSQYYCDPHPLIALPKYCQPHTLGASTPWLIPAAPWRLPHTKLSSTFLFSKHQHRMSQIPQNFSLFSLAEITLQNHAIFFT